MPNQVKKPGAISPLGSNDSFAPERATPGAISPLRSNDPNDPRMPRLKLNFHRNRIELIKVVIQNVDCKFHLADLIRVHDTYTFQIGIRQMG